MNPFDSNAAWDSSASNLSNRSDSFAIDPNTQLEYVCNNKDGFVFEQVSKEMHNSKAKTTEEYLDSEKETTPPLRNPPPPIKLVKLDNPKGKTSTLFTLQNINSIVSSKKDHQELKTKTKMEIINLKKTLLERQIEIASVELEIKKVQLWLEQIKLARDEAGNGFI